jgi:hypothetical protein
VATRSKGEVNLGANHLGFRYGKSPESGAKRTVQAEGANFCVDVRGEALICVDFEMQIFNSLTNMIKNKYNYYICGLLVALGCFTFLGCQTSTTGASSSTAHLTVQRGSKFGTKSVLAVMVDSARVASLTEGQAYNGALSPGHHVISVSVSGPSRFASPTKTVVAEAGHTYTFTATWDGKHLVLQ